MRTATVALLVVVAALAGAGVPAATAGVQEDCSFPVTETDATDTAVTVDEEPARVVTLAPSAAQTMWEVGAREKVVGVSEFATYLEGADTRRNVSAGGDAFVSVEEVVAADPDLVLAPNVIVNDTVERLREANLTVYRFGSATSIEDVISKTQLTGTLVGECEGADETVAEMDRRLETVRQAVADADRPRVLYTFFGFTAGEGTFIHELITTAGGDNVAVRANITGFQQVSPEVVVDQNPEWIVVNDGATTVPNTEAYNQTAAVQNDRVVVVREEHVSQPAPRVVEAIATMAEAFHPEAYEAANETTTATDTAAETSSPGTPGFGPVVVVVGLVAALWVRER